MRTKIALLAVAALALVAAGCGSSGGSSSASSSTPATTTSTQKTAAEKSPPGDIPDSTAFVPFNMTACGFTVKVPEGWARTGGAQKVTFASNLNSVTVACRKGPGQSTTTTRYLAHGKANPVTGKAVTEEVERHVYGHNGTQAVLTLSGPKGADNVDPWKTISDSLRWTQ